MLGVFVESLHQAGPLFIIAVVILVGVAFGEAARAIGLPSVTGQILAGILIGPAGFDFFSHEGLAGIQPVTHLALGLIAVTIGAHLNIQRLRNAGRRLFFLLLTEATLAPTIVFVALWSIAGASPSEALLFSTIAIATAPATVVSLVKETRSKGVFVKTLVAAVALNNMACIFLFEIARALTKSWRPGDTGFNLQIDEPVSQLLIAIAIGGFVALAMDFISRLNVRSERLATAAVAALLLTTGLADVFHVSPLLACLFLGIIHTNITPSRSHLVDSIFADFEPAILTVFFTLAGMHVSPDHLTGASIAAIVLFSARVVGKMVAANLAMRLAGATERVRKYLGLALIPQAGVAVGLVLILQEDPAFHETAAMFTSVVLAVVTANEIVGPVALRIALSRAGEADRDRVRLIDFLQEEHIITNFRASTKEEAIEKLVDLALRTHEFPVAVDRDAFLQSVLEREAEASTCLGGGLALPHGILPPSCPMTGVMALSESGLDFESPDGRPIHCMVLIGTAGEERDRHLQVLATLARTVGTDLAFQEQLFTTTSPAHAYELIHGEESEGFNYFLDER